MRLHRLHIEGFGALREVMVPLSAGVTVLLGPNEAGKSTVLHCLAQVLFGKPSQRSLFPDLAPWDGGSFAAAVEFTRDGERYWLSRRFDETGARAVALHRLRDDGTEALVTQEAAEVRKWVATAFGAADDRIFYRVFCLTQADLTPLDNFSGLREQLERAAGGTDVAVAAAVGRVDERLAAWRRGVGMPALAQNWGALKRADEARREWEARLHEAHRQERRLADARAEAAALQAQLAGAGERLEAIAALLTDDRRRRELRERHDELRAAWAAVDHERDRLARLAADRDRLAEALAGADPVGLRERLTALTALRGPATPLIGWLLILLGVMLAMVLWLAWAHPLGWAALLLSAIGLPLALRAQRRSRLTRQLCAELGIAASSEAARRLDALETDRRELDATVLALAKMAPAEEVEERRRNLTRELAVLEERLRALPGAPLTAEAANRLVTEELSLRAGLPDWRERERALLRELAVLEESERDLTDVEDGVAYWRAEEARAREEEQALALARELLIEAGQQAHRALAHPLAEGITPLFAGMTGGRYPRVRVEGDARNLHLFPVDAAGAPVPPEQLSRGARDQFLLAVRLALGQVIAGPTGSPIFLLDDPLLHFDAARRREALDLLASLGRHTQIILATHDASVAEALEDAVVVRL